MGMSIHRGWSVAGGAVAAIVGSGFSLAAQSNPRITVEEFAWIAGTWEGAGPLDHEAETHATSIFTAPVEGVISWTFRWNTPENGHVHFAFTVMENTDAGVVSRGIHHGRNFATFEEHPWTFRADEVSDTRVRFTCVENCRVRSLTFQLTTDGSLLEQYQPLDDTAPLSVFEYRRVSPGGR